MSLFESIEPVSMAKEMESSFMDYAMSVIVSRALPDVRDGLKPVHRRILYALHDLGIGWDKPYRKSAYMVGEVLGKYHPHGDSSVYDAAVRMVQDFVTRYPLIDGQGNWGSVDGDSAAALRYTELRMSKISDEMLFDIEKDTVDFMDNYDATRKEPVVLPARIPNLLINGSTGIAVGMATNIPPHNIVEVVNGLVYLIDHPDASVRDLLKYIKGPDFPTGGLVLGMDGIIKSYETGRGSIKMRAKTEFENIKGGKTAIIVRELPFQVNKARLVEKIADLAKDKTVVDGISDLRDESDRDGIRIVIELKREANPHLVLNQLFKHTQLEESFGVIMLALVNGEPRELNLKEILEYYLEHRKEVVIRSTRYDLDQAEKRLHILDGLKIAIDNLDEVIKIIRAAKDTLEARKQLQERFPFSDAQAGAVLDMRLQKLTGLERKNLENEISRLSESVKNYKDILGSRTMVLNIIKADLKDIKSRFGDARRTEVLKEIVEMPIKDTVPEEDVLLIFTQQGYLKRQKINDLMVPRRDGARANGSLNPQDGFIREIVTASTHDSILLLSNRGRLFKLGIHNIKETTGQSRGSNLNNVLSLNPGERITFTSILAEVDPDIYLIIVSRGGMIKKTSLSELDFSRSDGVSVITLNEGDEVAAAKISAGQDEILLVTNNGILIRFSEAEIRVSGRNSKGVRAVNLAGSRVISMGLVSEGVSILLVTENGFSKRTSLEEFSCQARGGKGIKCMNISKETAELCYMIVAGQVGEFSLLTTSGRVAVCSYHDIILTSRTMRGERIKVLSSEEKISAISATSAQPLSKEE